MPSKSSTFQMNLQHVWSAARQAGSAGELAVFRGTYLEAVRLSGIIEAAPGTFADHWHDLLDFKFDSGDISGGFRCLDIAARLGLVDLRALPLLDEIRELYARFPPAFDSARALVLNVAEGRSSTAAADHRIVGWMRLFNPASRKPAYACNAWLNIAAEVLRASERTGRSCVFVPEYLATLVAFSGSRTLSWHTTGRAEGLTHFKPADLPPYVVVDPAGYSGWSSLSGCALSSLDLASEVVAQEFWVRHQHEVFTANVSKYSQKSLSTLPELPPDYVFVAMQVADDRTQELADVPMLEMLDIVVRRFLGSATRVVVKRHPLCRSEAVGTRLAQLSATGAIILSDASIHPLIEGSRAVIAVNSGVGSEAIAHLKPIYLFGAADYDCVAHRVRGEEDFARLTTPIRPAVSLADYKRFLHYYRTRYQVDLREPARITEVVSRFVGVQDV
jgi:hypothetical protein